MATIRVVLADDHALMRAGLRAILGNLPDIEVVAEAADGRTAAELCIRHRPDIVLLDVSMSGLNGIGAAEQIVKAGIGTRVIILSMFGSEEYVLQALRAGASGYILKGASTSELELAIRTVADGETFLGPSISSTVISGYLDMATRGKHSSEVLTSRQREVLQLLAEGNSTKQIAYLLKVSVKTVETHRAMLMERLGIRDLPGLTRYAMRAGLVAAEQEDSREHPQGFRTGP
jgi:DNA-binding NarL/FixJ family response regulator